MAENPYPPHISRPGTPENPPTSRNILHASRYANSLLLEIENGNQDVTSDHFAKAKSAEHDLIANYSLQAADGGGSGVLGILMEIRQGVRNLREDVEALKEDVGTLKEDVRQLKDNDELLERLTYSLDKRSIRSSNSLRGTGLAYPYEILRFGDGTTPSQATDGRRALPPLSNRNSLLTISLDDVKLYLDGYGYSEQEITELGDEIACRKRLGEEIGVVLYPFP